ncbi:MAG: hypothetical protein JWN66_3726 [Sphingomonas bacterium]|uniref:hypothetical protein n=1 Tax=Sphingomonas bacterium TaxID=1895847 RepID=UPI00261D1EB8|nr:hypothetical protein [Sphingomonas bacterium]MDB5706610.1 hypothetical protein [Sphingomonas bacterium]
MDIKWTRLDEFYLYQSVLTRADYTEHVRTRLLADTAIIDEAMRRRKGFSFPDTTSIHELVDAVRSFQSWVHREEEYVTAVKGVDKLDWASMPSEELWQYEKPVADFAHVVQNAEHYFGEVAKVITFVSDQFSPTHDKIARGPFVPLCDVPLFELLPDPRKSVDDVYRVFAQWPMNGCILLRRLITQLKSNFGWLCIDHQLDSNKVRPSAIPISGRELVERLFNDTPILNFFMVEVPVRWIYPARWSHTHVMGRTDSGKTTLLERMIHGDILCPVTRSIVVMTPHGGLIKKLCSMNASLSEQMILIDPRDIEYPPAINPFAINRERLASYSPSDREKVTNNVIKTFDYIFSSLGLDFTAKQRTLWKYVIRMLLTLPTVRGVNATILDILRFLEKPEAYEDVIDELPDVQRNFFNESVMNNHKAFKETREQIANRIHDVVSDPNLERLLTAPESKIDFYDELQNKCSIILIDTAKDFLGDGSSIFGGTMLAMIFQAMFEREVLPEADRQTTFVYIDEASNYFSDDISDMLTELRKYHCGLILAHHELAQASKRSSSLASSLVSQPGIKFCAPSASDAPTMAKEMRTTTDFLRNLPPNHFAMYINGITPNPIAIKIKPIETGTMSFAEQQAFLWRNRGKVSLGPPAEGKSRKSSSSVPASKREQNAPPAASSTDDEFVEQ